VSSSHRVDHNDKNKILNGYYMNEIIHFKVYVLCNMMWSKCVWILM
jgi:hypothetical protein